MLYYVDANIWMNLWKKEGDQSKGIPYWQIAEIFIDRLLFSENKEILYSGFILKELKHKLGSSLFREKLRYLKSEFHFVKALQDDYDLARKIEDKFRFGISFFDCAHIALSSRTNSVLVTRDEKLIKCARKYVIADRPEKLLA